MREGDTDVIIGGNTSFDVGTTPQFGYSAVTAPVMQPTSVGAITGGGGYLGAIPSPLYGPIVGASAFGSSIQTFDMEPFSQPFLQPAAQPAPQPTSQVLYAHYAPTQPAVAQPAPVVAQPAAPTAPVIAGGTTTQPAATPPKENRTGGKKKQQPKTEPKQADKAEPKNDGGGGGGKKVTVKSGDTLSKIAAAHGVSWQRLYEMNKGVIGGNPNLIRPGQVLRLP